MRNPLQCFLGLTNFLKKNVLLVLKQELAMPKKHQLFATVLTIPYILSVHIIDGSVATVIVCFRVSCAFPSKVYARTKQHAHSQRL